MQRVMIIGVGGAGKSWLAKRLGAATGLPVTHLDREFWKPGWVETPSPVWHAKMRELVAEDRWILDGNYGSTMELRMARADTIIFLDVPRWHALAGIFRRRLAGHRPDIAPGCPEQVNLEFVRWVWRFHHRNRPEILERLTRYRDGRTVHVLRSRAAVMQFLGTV
jgi:adenylate kinase family enzyme